MKKNVNKYQYEIVKLDEDRYIGKIYKVDTGLFGWFSKLTFLGCIQFLPEDELGFRKDMWDEHLWTTAGSIAKYAIHTNPELLKEKLKTYVTKLNIIENHIEE